MAGMEEIEIHSKSYLLRWVNAKPEHTITWTVQPHKKSINFGIWKHPGHIAVSSTPSSNVALFPPPSPSLMVTEDPDKPESPQSVVMEKLKSIGLKQVSWYGKCEADKATQGKYEVPAGEGGNYALVLDNTFSKSIAKTATLSVICYPTSLQSQISFGAQMHHSQVGNQPHGPSAMASAMAIANSQGPQKSPKLRPFGKSSADSLRRMSSATAQPPRSESAVSIDEPSSIHTGVLQKRRRKKHQGFARRFFCLDFTSSTLSYYHDRNSSALRGAIPLSLAVIGANAKTREISIDSGAEIWLLRANNIADFHAWKEALERASSMTQESPGAFDLSTSFQPTGRAGSTEEQDWERLETLLSRVSGTRDAVRRLCQETALTISPRSGSNPPSGPPTPLDGTPQDYFGNAMDDKRPFWKRKVSAPNVPANIFRRSISSQLAVPAPSIEPVLRNGSPIGLPPSRQQHNHEEGMHDHCRALLRDMDRLVNDFSTIMNERKVKKGFPQSAVSRLSIQSVDSQEYFDAEDFDQRQSSQVLDLHSDSERETSTDTEGPAADDDSATSSEIGDDDLDRRVRSGSLSSFIPPKSKSLSPLPLEPIKRRANVAAPTIMPPSLIGFLRKNVGKDLSTIAMPVSANEPTSLLQRAAEQLEYSELLDAAAKLQEPMEQLIFVTAFAISSLSNTRVKERSIRKPFNPMLGETYELVREDKGFRFISEKVSHRPVQLAFHAESSDWSFSQSPKPIQKFWGKSSEINTEGKARLVFYESAQSYSWTAPTCFLRNLIAGEKYVEPVGTMTVVNETSGQKAIVTFKAKGMFSGRSEDVEVQVIDAHGHPLANGLSGNWVHSLQRTHNGAVTKQAVWTAGPLVEHAPKHYGMTAFAATLNEVTAIERGKLPPTDSRLRPDQQALEGGQVDDAERLKNQLEEGQRERRKQMEAGGEEWKPRWFVKIDHGDGAIWKLKTGKDGYWDERARGQWTGVVPVLKL